jgi:hypothetical protein
MGRRKDVYLTDDEADAMDIVMEAYEASSSVTATSSGIDQAILESLLVKGPLQSPDGVQFAVILADFHSRPRGAQPL